MARAAWFPSLSAGYFNQEIDNVTGFEGFQAGLRFPLVFPSTGSLVKKAKIQYQIDANLRLIEKTQQISQLENELISYEKNKLRFEAFNDEIINRTNEMLNTVRLRFEKGEINYFEFLQSLESVYGLRYEYFNSLRDYNNSGLTLKYYSPE